MKRLLQCAIAGIGAVCVLLCLQLAVQATVTLKDDLDGLTTLSATYYNLSIVPGRLSQRTGTTCPDDSVAGPNSLAGGSATYAVSGSGRVRIGVYAHMSLSAAPSTLPGTFAYVVGSAPLSAARNGDSIDLSACLPLYLGDGELYLQNGSGQWYVMVLHEAREAHAFEPVPTETVPMTRLAPYGLTVAASGPGGWSFVSATAVSAHVYGSYTYYEFIADIPAGSTGVRVTVQDFVTMRSAEGPTYPNPAVNGLYLGSVTFEGAFSLTPSPSTGTVSPSRTVSIPSQSSSSSTDTLLPSGNETSSSSSRETLSYSSRSSSRSSNVLVVPAPASPTPSSGTDGSSSSSAAASSARSSSRSSTKSSTAATASTGSGTGRRLSAAAADDAAAPDGPDAGMQVSVEEEIVDLAQVGGVVAGVREAQTQARWLAGVYIGSATVLLVGILYRDPLLQLLRGRRKPPSG